MASSAKNDVLDELKPYTLTKVIGRKPNHEDVEVWEEEAAEGATLIKTNYHPQGQTLGHLADVISEEELRLEIEDEDWTYEIQTDPGPYNTEITGDEDEWVIKRMEAEHKSAQIDYYKGEGVQEHYRRQFQKCMDPTWIAGLRKVRGGFANITIKAFLSHLRNDVAKLTTKQKKEMKKRIEIEWNRTKDITEYFQRMTELRVKLESWGVTVDDDDMVNAAVTQMQDSGLFDRKFLREWEQRPEGEKTWTNMVEYYKEEYMAIKQFDDPTNHHFESVNSMTENNNGHDITEFMEDLRINSTTSNEQIQQIATAFKGTSETLSEVLDRLKSAMDENKVLLQTVERLTETNKTLANTNKTLTNTISTMGGKSTALTVERGKCPHCDAVHAKPFIDTCWKLEKNKHLKEKYDKNMAAKKERQAKSS